MGVLYAEDGKIMCRCYFEIYIPMEYFNNGNAINHGTNIETLGLLYCRAFENGKEGEIKLFNLPISANIQVYDYGDTVLNIRGREIAVMALRYLPKSYIVHQTLPKGRDVAYMFLTMVLGGRIPTTINYANLIDIWWKNLELAGISYKVPSKIYELILAAIYRNAKNPKERYGQYYGKQTNPSGYDYETNNVRQVVKNLSTFSGMIYEDIGTMISNGIDNSLKGIEEPVSPLEKIIHY